MIDTPKATVVEVEFSRVWIRNNPDLFAKSVHDFHSKYGHGKVTIDDSWNGRVIYKSDMR